MGKAMRNEIADCVMSIAASRTLVELGATCHHAASALTGASAFGLYLLQDGRPNLIYSRSAPWGFLEEYRRELAPVDPMLDRISETRTAVSGETLSASPAANVRIMVDLLRRWGFGHNMCGPILHENRIAGIIYAAGAERAQEANDVITERMDYVCRSASLALRSILAAADRQDRDIGEDETDKAIFAAQWSTMLPPRSAEVAKRLCQGETNKEIARAMAISHHTVKEHVTNLCRRFHVQNRTELVSMILNLARWARQPGDMPQPGAPQAPSDGAWPHFVSEYSVDYF